MTVADRRVSLRAGAILGALLSCSGAAGAQTVTESSLKAAFIYNVAKFTEWPQGVPPPSAPFVACVLGDRSIGDALERTVSGRLLFGRSICVSRVTLDGSLRACHMLYVAGAASAQTEKVLASVRDAPVLTITDAEDSGQPESVVRMFVENGRLRFALSLDLARRSRLQLSSKLLVLAQRIQDESNPGKR